MKELEKVLQTLSTDGELKCDEKNGEKDEEQLKNPLNSEEQKFENTMNKNESSGEENVESSKAESNNLEKSIEIIEQKFESSDEQINDKESNVRKRIVITEK